MTTSQISVAIVYHSGYGHTQKQAEAVAKGAQEVDGTLVELYQVATLNDELWERLEHADAIVFGSPTYMGGPSAVFKKFMEASSSKVWGRNLKWKDKIAGGFTNSQNINGDKLNTLTSLALFAAQHGMHWVGLGIYGGWNTKSASIDDVNRLGSFIGAMAQSNGDASPEEAPPASDLKTASILGRRIAETTHQFVYGRRIWNSR
ncbi:flavodoxin family protein [Paenibacillus sp. OAS669]|uniref:flavodoxin family protein n=1 Tax=Paenibacillus sp. OAS669 TaxID=2663821 RepID=UPI00178AF756|nr:flavodoxin family protein [Paenibacillus sp. OAS669]MBE1442536.1 multimeric flavodoxin WrbA [Paenibacillus sp. OAS669]